MIADIASIELESVAVVITIRFAARKDAHSISFLFITGFSRSSTPEQEPSLGPEGCAPPRLSQAYRDRQKIGSIPMDQIYIPWSIYRIEGDSNRNSLSICTTTFVGGDAQRSGKLNELGERIRTHFLHQMAPMHFDRGFAGP